jgi:hypothetical protein
MADIYYYDSDDVSHHTDEYNYDTSCEETTLTLHTLSEHKNPL